MARGSIALSLGALLLAAPAAAQVRPLSQFPAAGAIAPTDTVPVCQTAGGCNATVDLHAATAAQLRAYAISGLTPANMPATPAHFISGSYPLTASDLGLPVCLRGSSGPATITLPLAGSAGFTAGAIYTVCDTDPNPLTIAASGSDALLGAAVNPLTKGMWALLDPGAGNWLVLESGGAAPLPAPVLGAGP